MTTFEAYIVGRADLENAINALELFPLPVGVGGLREISIDDDDGALDFSGDTDQTVASQDLGSNTAIERLEVIEVTPVVGDSVQSLAALFLPNGEAFLIPLNDDGDELLQTIPPGNDLTGQSFIVNSVTEDPGPVAYCFAGETLIATPRGPVMVKDLAIGDEVVTFGGNAVLVAWVGRQTVDLRLSAPERLLPVKIKRGALGESVPSRDLILTRDHAVLVSGILANAGALINGTTIVSVPRREIGPVVTYYHIDTCGHHLVLANDVPAETLIDQPGARACFDNYDEYVTLFGNRALDTPELFYPRAMSLRQLAAGVREHLSTRALVLALPNRDVA